MAMGVTTNFFFGSGLPCEFRPRRSSGIDRPLEGVAGAPLLLLDEHGNVVVDGKSGSHIMMLGHKAS